MHEQEDPALQVTDHDFFISRVLNAPPERVFDAWTDPKQVTNWWGPRGFANPVCELDVRPDGAHRITMRSADGVDYPITGEFLEVVRPERLVMTLDCAEHPAAWHDMVAPDRSKDNTNPAGVMVQTVTFEDLEGSTRLSIRTRFESAEIRNAMVKMGMNEGWGQSLDRLAEHLAK